MPNNCSTLIQRKQNIIHKSLRTSSDGKLQNAVTETTCELRNASSQKTPIYPSVTNNTGDGSRTLSANRRTNLFTSNRVHPNDYNTAAHLPSIRDANGTAERPNQPYDGLQTPRSKTPLTNTSPKTYLHSASVEASSPLYNAHPKRSADNFMSSNGEFEELILPASRQSRRPSNESGKYVTGTTQTATKDSIMSQKQSIDSVADNTRYSFSPLENHQQEQQRLYTSTNRIKSAVPNAHIENHLATETNSRERVHNGQIYQRRTNNIVKAPIKQKIDKYRRRSEEATQAMHTNGLISTANAGLSATTPALVHLASSRLKPPPPSPAPVRRVTSDGEIQARLDVLRLSMNSNLVQIEQQHRQSQASRRHSKSPQLYSAHQQLAPQATPQTPPVVLRRSHLNSTGSHSQHRQNTGTHHRRSQQSSVKHSANTNQGNLYLAFIASRHLSALDEAQVEYDIDHPKLLRIFTWLKETNKYRHEQLSHDKLIIEQNQRLLDQEENLSLYSEIQHAVDDLPANTTGKLCERIAPMDFDK